MLFTDHDSLHIHKILGVSCLAHYGYRIYCKLKFGNMFFESSPLVLYATPIIHLSLSLSSFLFHVPKYRFSSKVIIWKELQLHNIIFISRSVSVMLHILLANPKYTMFYYFTRMSIVMIHHYLADFVSFVYQVDNKTTTRDIPYDNTNRLISYVNKKYYAASQLAAISNLLLTKNYEGPFIIMFPIHLSTFLMTLVRKNIITNSQWHILYGLSLAVPIGLHYKMLTPSNDKFYLSIMFVLARLTFNMNKYVNMITLTSSYVALQLDQGL